jgi:TPR repeat protein
MILCNKRFVILLLFLAALGRPLTARSQANCPPVKIADFPKSDLPVRLDTMWAKSAGIQLLESYKYYYGIGVPVDFVKARYLAFIEMAMHPDGAGEFEGPSVLLMLYANGFGVKRDLDISIRLACANVGGAGAEVEGPGQNAGGRPEWKGRAGI